MLLLVIVALVCTGCPDPGRRAVTQPADQPDEPKVSEPAPKDEPVLPPATSQPVDETQTTAPPGPTAEVSDEPAPKPKWEPDVRPPRKPRRPVDSWIIFRQAVDPETDASCTMKWTGGNRLEVHTENIERITIDLTKLPEGAPKKGPWNLQIDGQGIEMTGFRPKPGYTGKVRDLVRSVNGVWSVDRKTLYRLGV